MIYINWIYYYSYRPQSAGATSVRSWNQQLQHDDYLDPQKAFTSEYVWVNTMIRFSTQVFPWYLIKIEFVYPYSIHLTIGLNCYNFWNFKKPSTRSRSLLIFFSIFLDIGKTDLSDVKFRDASNGVISYQKNSFLI